MQYKTAIIMGTGLGGLLTGAFLATQGWQVTLFEALSIPGGRFTHIDYDGFAVPTGAFHAFPGGAQGPIARCLRRLGIACDLVHPSPAFQITVAGQSYPLDVRRAVTARSGLAHAVGITNKHRIIFRLIRAGLQGLCGGDTSVASLFAGACADERAVRLVDHLTKFAQGVPAASASAVDLLRSFAVQRFHGEGILRQGSRSMVEALLQRALRCGATVYTETPVARIRVLHGVAVGITTAAGREHNADLLISNTGATQTALLLGEHAPAAFTEKVRRMEPAYGASHAIRSTRRLQSRQSIEIPVDLDHISGIVPLSNISPCLCPAGWSYSLAYQALDRAGSIPAQLAAAQGELRDHLGKDIDIFNTAVYQGTHPAAFMVQRTGQHGKSRIPAQIPGIAHLNLVGQDVAGYGFAAEVIGHSCQALWRKLV